MNFTIKAMNYLKIVITRYIYILYRAGYNLVHHDGIEHAGYMSFMTILSIFPFLVFLLALAGFIGETEFGIKFTHMFIEILPSDIITALKPRFQEIILGPPQSLLTISILGAVWTSSSSVEGIRTILNRVYNIKTPPAYILRRMMSIIQFIILTFLILLTMFISVIVPIIYQKLVLLFNIHEFIQDSNLFASVFSSPVKEYIGQLTVAMTLFFAVSGLYCIIPNTKISFKSVIPGSIIVVIGWIISGTVIMSFIAAYEQVNLIYGSLASIIVAMIFFFIINTIFIYGAELNCLLAQNCNSKK